MSSTISVPSAPATAVHPPAIALRDLAPFLVLAVALLALVYFVGVEAGAISLVPGMSVHEWVHDGRHLLGFPCH